MQTTGIKLFGRCWTIYQCKVLSISLNHPLSDILVTSYDILSILKFGLERTFYKISFFIRGELFLLGRMIFIQDYVLVQSTHWSYYFLASSARLKCFLLRSAHQSSNLLLFNRFQTFFLLRYRTWFYHFFSRLINVFRIRGTFPVVMKFSARVHNS